MSKQILSSDLINSILKIQRYVKSDNFVPLNFHNFMQKCLDEKEDFNTCVSQIIKRLILIINKHESNIISIMRKHIHLLDKRVFIYKPLINLLKVKKVKKVKTETFEVMKMTICLVIVFCVFIFPAVF